MRLQRQMLVGMAVERAEQRAARALLLLADRLGRRTPQGLLTPMVLDRQEFSEMIGTTVETAIRVLSRMRRDGIIHEEKHHLVVLDEARLYHLAGLEDERVARGSNREESRDGICVGCLAC
jgi:CRP/FNR family transcriptional regulator